MSAPFRPARWIHLARVTRGVFIQRANAGYPGGLSFFWSGRDHPLQPWEFLDWNEALWAVHTRLKMARLFPLAVAIGGDSYDGMGRRQFALRVLVGRKSEQKSGKQKAEISE